MSLDVSLLVDHEYVFDANITHNLSGMANAAGIYQHLWRPDELGITTAGDLIEPLTAGLHRMIDDPATFQAFNPDNGWGSWKVFVPWVAEYVAACRRWPTATIRISR